jgi:hypothetical protein
MSSLNNNCEKENSIFPSLRSIKPADLVVLDGQHQHLKNHCSIPTTTTTNMCLPISNSTSSKKLRMNEPLIGENALKYCQQVLESGWISVEGPFVKRLLGKSFFFSFCRTSNLFV